MRAIDVVFCIFGLVLCCAVVPSLGTSYTVGETSGWTTNYDYSTWTKGKTFAVGDTLVFNFAGGHTVDEVSEGDYSSCTVGNSITSSSTGPTSVTLKTPGTHYFICGVIGHCGNGMKLAVTVAGGATDAGNSTSPTTTPSTTPTTPTPVTTIPKTTTTNTYSASNSLCPPSMAVAVLLAGLTMLFKLCFS